MSIFFHSGSDLLRVVIVGMCAYVALIALLRVSGKRTLSKMNAFDFVVTVALGSTLATILLSKEVALLEGVVGFITLILLQFIISWLAVRSETVRRLVKAEPALLFYQGRFIQKSLIQERVTQDEVHAAVRSQGLAAMEAVDAVVLETDGTFTVLQSSGQAATALRGVARIEETAESKRHE